MFKHYIHIALPTPSKMSSTGFAAIKEDEENLDLTSVLSDPVKLPGGYIAKPCWIITRDVESWSEGEIAQVQTLNARWVNKKDPYAIPVLQRSPFIWVDNFTFFFRKDMEEPELLLGEWNKKATLYGKEQKVHGLVVGGGGHFERMGDKTEPSTDIFSSRGTFTKSGNAEEGDMTLRAAADKEIFEELKIPPEKVKSTVFLCVIDDPFNDPRTHGMRTVFLRWVEIAPRSSEELKSVISVPLSMMSDLCDRKIAWTSPKGEKLNLILNHGEMIKAVLHHPATQEFLARVKTFYDSTSQKKMKRVKTFS